MLQTLPRSSCRAGADGMLQVEYFKKQRVVNYQKEQTIKKIEAEGGEIIAPQLPVRK